MTAEDGGIIKLLHYLSIVSNIVLVPIILPRPLINIACLICYLLLALFKHTIMCSNLTYKNLLIRAYLLCACIHLSNIIISFLSIAPILGGTFSLILSQAGYTLYLHNRTITSID